jgi:hypothetical protein
MHGTSRISEERGCMRRLPTGKSRRRADADVDQSDVRGIEEIAGDECAFGSGRRF